MISIAQLYPLIPLTTNEDAAPEDARKHQLGRWRGGVESSREVDAGSESSGGWYWYFGRENKSPSTNPVPTQSATHVQSGIFG